MNCVNHENRPAEGTCVECGKPFCKECLVEVNNKYYCKKHVADIINQQTSNNSDIIIEDAPKSSPKAETYEMYPYSYKRKVIALLLCIFLGPAGIHRFYVGKIGTGILYLLTGGLFGIGWIVDIIKIATGSFKDRRGYYLK